MKLTRSALGWLVLSVLAVACSDDNDDYAPVVDLDAGRDIDAGLSTDSGHPPDDAGGDLDAGHPIPMDAALGLGLFVSSSTSVRGDLGHVGTGPTRGARIPPE